VQGAKRRQGGTLSSIGNAAIAPEQRGRTHVLALRLL
jgi:hypothetical protein